METYAQMKQRHQEEYNSFAEKHVHYAFGREQTEELLNKLGMTAEQVAASYCGLPGGGIILKKDYPLLVDLFNRQAQEWKAMRKSEDQLYRMFYQTMADYEYIVTGDDMEIIAHCGISKKEFNSAKRYPKAWFRAKEQYLHDFEPKGDDEE